MKKFAIEQIALCPRDPKAAIALLSALGLSDWVSDLVVAEGDVRGEEGCTNVAELNFNYQASPPEGKSLELEVLHYKAGDNWMSEAPFSVSHLGMHCTTNELYDIHREMVRRNIPVVQKVDTKSHTNPVIANSRRYTYTIYGTREILGVDLKFIVRRELPQAAPAAGSAA